MSWYNSAWQFRRAITIDNSAAAAAPDVSFDLPTDDDHFWANVQSDGDDVRVTNSAGRTLLTYDVATWNQANRTGTVRIDAPALEATAGMYLAWVYYGNSAAATGAGVPVIAAPVTAYIDLGAPTARRILVRPEAPGATVARAVVQKTASEGVFVWWDITDELEPRNRQFAGRNRYEEPFYCSFRVTLAGAAQAGMVSATAQRFVEIGNRVWVRTFVQAGTTGVTYTAELTVVTRPSTSNYRTINPRARLIVEDVNES